MARSMFDEADRGDRAKALRDKLAQIRSAALVVKAKAAELQADRAAIEAAVASGAFDRADVDVLDAMAVKVAAFYQAAQAYLG